MLVLRLCTWICCHQGPGPGKGREAEAGIQGPAHTLASRELTGPLQPTKDTVCPWAPPLRQLTLTAESRHLGFSPVSQKWVPVDTMEGLQILQDTEAAGLVYNPSPQEGQAALESGGRLPWLSRAW